MKAIDQLDTFPLIFAYSSNVTKETKQKVMKAGFYDCLESKLTKMQFEKII